MRVMFNSFIKIRMVQIIVFVLHLASIGYAAAAPGGGFVAAGVAKPPIFFDGANVGVNFGGYHASAGLGGILGGGAAGGLHAEAGTPYGQGAAAGLGGVVAKGESAGGLYAGADSGAGAAAGAAIGGIAADVGPAVVVEKTVHETPKVQKTYVERTVIPNYVEKTIQVPSYVEKTVRVPTVVEKRIKVPAPPTIIEKTINAPPSEVKTTSVGKVDIETTFGGGAGGFADAGGYHSHEYYGSGYGGGASGVYGYRKTFNPNLVNDIFNIPISTLSAVSRLVGGIAGGASGGGSFYVGKHIG